MIKNLVIEHGTRAYKDIYYNILWENRTDEAFITFIKIIQLNPNDAMIVILINRIIRWNLFGDKYDSVIRILNNSMSVMCKKHWGIFSVVMDMLRTPTNEQLCLELLSHPSALALTKTFRIDAGNIAISPVIHWYGRHRVKYMINCGKFYSSIVMRIYADSIYDSIFKYWVWYRKFRSSFHALILYICENMTAGIMKQLNQHLSDFAEMLLLGQRHNTRVDKIIMLLITKGLDIFSKCYGDMNLYYLIEVDGSKRLKKFINIFG